MEGIEHKSLTINGINMHVAEIGQGPFVLFLHGFPECLYAWRHQMGFMASQGFRAVAPDLRGYGDTTGAPVNDFTKFTNLHVVGDVVALLNAVAAQEEKVFVVGHDWGAMIAWALCLYRPDKVKALVNLSVAFSPRNPSNKPVEILRSVCGEDYYICRFQEPGEIEGEFAYTGTKRVLKSFLSYRNPGPLYLPKGKWFGSLGDSADTPIILPSWLSEEEVDYYASKYEKSGFTGALNYYRALDINWELTAPWTGDQIQVPVKFIVGDLDLTYNAPGTKDFVHKGGFKRYVPLLKEVVVMKGVAHFIHEEKPDEINKHILDFFQEFSLPPSSTM
ncbi:bifunctional epoxide hydrolase 2-like [Olea europaea subsp. europaea]|nr:bifunctional epoxide hydrolase 2-like [Olea europaea subsp. europaea]